MKTYLFAIVIGIAAVAGNVFGMTVEFAADSAFVREHSKQFSVSVSRGKEGLIDFTIKHNVETPMYHVAHLAIYNRGNLIATSDIPSYGKKQGNTFYFSLAPESVADSKFELSDIAVVGSGEDAVPVPGTAIYKFPLLDFVPEGMLTTAPQ